MENSTEVLKIRQPTREWKFEDRLRAETGYEREVETLRAGTRKIRHGIQSSRRLHSTVRCKGQGKIKSRNRQESRR